VDQYACEVKYIDGRDPELVLSEVGVETSRIDLRQYATQESLHQLLASSGVARKQASTMSVHERAAAGLPIHPSERWKVTADEGFGIKATPPAAAYANVVHQQPTAAAAATSANEPERRVHPSERWKLRQQVQQPTAASDANARAANVHPSERWKLRTEL